MLLFNQGIVELMMANNNTLNNSENLASAGVRFLRDTRADQLLERISLPHSDSTSQDVQEFTRAIHEEAQRSFESQMEFLKRKARSTQN